MVSVVQEESVQAKPQVSQSAAETLIEKLSSLSGREMDAEQLRVRIGRRFEHGVTGNERRELNEDQAKAVLDAIALPAAEGISFDDYIDSIPNIRISAGDEVLFSQERDGVVSVNDFQIEQQIEIVATAAEAAYTDGDRIVEAAVLAADSEQIAAAPPTSYAAATMTPVATIVIEQEQPAAAELTGDEQIASLVRAGDLLTMAQAIVQPLEVGRAAELNTPEPIETGLGAYTIRIEGKDATVSKGDEVLLKAVDGQITQSSLEEKDAAALQGWLEKSSYATESWTVPIQTADPTLIAIAEPIAIANQPVDVQPAMDVAKAQIAAMPEGRSKQFFQKLGASLDQGMERAAKTAQALHQDLKEHGRENAQKAVEKATVLTGKGLEKAGQWLAARPETIREQRAARNALALYKEGHSRTNETSFEHGGFKVAFDAKTNQYSLSDAKTDATLMRFEETSSRIPGHAKITLTEKAEIPREQYQSFDAVACSGEVVRGSAEVEARHAAASAEFADFCQKYALAEENNDCRTKNYRIQTSESSLSVSSLKSGHEIYRQDGDQMTSRLGQADFKALGLAQSIMERPSALLETGVNLKPSIELD